MQYCHKNGILILGIDLTTERNYPINVPARIRPSDSGSSAGYATDWKPINTATMTRLIISHNAIFFVVSSDGPPHRSEMFVHGPPK